MLLVVFIDFNYFEVVVIGNVKDKQVIDVIVWMDFEGLFNVVRDYLISMCGVMLIVIIMIVVSVLGVEQGTLICYVDSGDVLGDKLFVVGYVGMVFM